MKKIIGLALAGVTIFVGLIAADTYSKYKASLPFEPIEGKHFVKIQQTDNLKQALKTLGVNKGDSFEILSYSCPACKKMEPLFDHIAASNQITLHKFHLGTINSEAGKAEYMVKHMATENLKDFRSKMFDKYLGSASIEEKKSFAKSIPLTYGITSEQMETMNSNAEEYTKAVNSLADAINLKSTPSIYLGGKYYIIQQNHKSGEEFLQTISHVMNLVELKS